MGPQKFNKYPDPVLGGKHLHHFSGKPLEGSVGDLDLIPFRHGGLDGDDLALVTFLDQLVTKAVDEGIRDSRIAGTEFKNVGDPIAVGDQTLLSLQIETGENLTGKQRLHPPDLPATRNLLIAKAWAQNLDSLVLPEACRGNVLPLGLRPQTIPSPSYRVFPHSPNTLWTRGRIKRACLLQWFNRDTRRS